MPPTFGLGLRTACAAVVAVLAIAACGGPPAVRTGPPLVASSPPLPPPVPIDPTARGARYLTEVGALIQPAWGQFLEDCRLRLPRDHALNQRALVATVEVAVARDGRVAPRLAVPSGNRDFDAAVLDVLRDVAPLPAPPAELQSDDDQVHLRWLFARDARQAGPATAQVIDLHLPLRGVIDRMIAAHALTRAAVRIARAPADDPERLPATEALMVAALRAALDSPIGAVRRSAVEAIGRARLVALAPQVHALAAPIADHDLRLAAIAAAAELGDASVAPVLGRALPDDLANRPRVALAEIAALATLGRPELATEPIRGALAGGPTPIGLAALALIPDRTLVPRLASWSASRDAGTRAAVCTALPAAAPTRALALIARGLRDADATVRATCTEAAARGLRVRGAGGAARDRGAPRWTAHELGLLRRLRELARDRDASVRARAIAALGAIDPGHRQRAVGDPSPEVRAASAIGAPDAALRELARDPEPDVRAAAIAALGDRAPELVEAATADLSAAVRRVALGLVTSDAALERLAADDMPDVATAALVRLAARRGRAASTPALLAGFATAAPTGDERVRIALAWLLAR